jgi:hypothetical protein
MWRAAAAGITVIVAAVIGVVTALVTTHPSRGLWVALGVVVVLGAVLQGVVTYGERRRQPHVDASGAGAVAIGGSAREAIQTHVQESHVPAAASDEHDGVIASGPGAVGVGGDAEGPVSTNVTIDEVKQDDD